MAAFFFFQAEDGIRDIGVTGVQTCALPISHASLDPKMKAYLIDRKITCPDGTVRIGFTPEVGAGPAPQGQTPQKGTWTIVSGTGEFEGLSGSGKSEAVYGPTPSSPVRSTFTGTVTR